MILALWLGFGLGVLATVLAGERDKRKPATWVVYSNYFRDSSESTKRQRAFEIITKAQDHT